MQNTIDQVTDALPCARPKIVKTIVQCCMYCVLHRVVESGVSDMDKGPTAIVPKGRPDILIQLTRMINASIATLALRGYAPARIVMTQETLQTQKSISPLQGS